MHADEITELVIGAAFEVANALGSGFLEKVYERALIQELRERRLKVKTQAEFYVRYKGKPVGKFLADIVVEDTVIVELKCAQTIVPQHVAQCINYLKASKLQVALVLNFQRSRLEWKRVVNGV